MTGQLEYATTADQSVLECSVVPKDSGNGQTTASNRKMGFVGRLTGFARFIWNYTIAIVCTQNVLLSLLFVGWTNRLTQRSIFKQWWRSGDRQNGGFREVIGAIESASGHVTHPRWVLRQNFREHLSASPVRFVQSLAHSLWLNLKTGIQVMFNTWVVTLPGCVFMLFSWEYGWNNSFYKGYEQAHIGPATGLFGIALFIAAMHYVPMATARQAATGNWKSFYDFPLVVRLIKRRAFWCMSLASLISLVALPVNLLKTIPGFLASGDGDFALRVQAMSPEEAFTFLSTYYFWAASLVVPAFILVRLAAGRIYASALLAEIRYGKEMPELSLAEHDVLGRLGLLRREESNSPLVVRAVAWTASRSGLLVATVVTMILWFTFISQTYVSEFLNYHGEYGLAWLNHPLIQLPFFRYIPSRLSP